MELLKTLLYIDNSRLAVLSSADAGTQQPTNGNQYLTNNSIAWMVFLPFVTFENILCLLAIASRRKWKSPDVLLFSIVFNNLLTLLFPVTVYTIFVFSRAPWSENLTACKFVVWCVMSFRIVNALQLAFLALDRVWTIKWPGSYTVHNTANQNARTAGLMWLFGISIGTVPLIGWEQPVIENCSLVLDVAGLGYTLCVVILIVGSSSISVGCVITMVIKLKFDDDFLQSSGSKQTVPEIVVQSETGERQTDGHDSRDLQNRQICTIVAWVVIVDVLINELPFTIFNFLALNKDVGDWLQVTITWCNIVFCASVPMMLCIICRRYRQGLFRVIRFLRMAVGCSEPMASLSNEVVSRQETIDSLDSYRPDDLEEPINFPEPVSQDILSMDDLHRESEEEEEEEEDDTPAWSSHQVYAETHENDAYVEDDTDMPSKRSEMTSQEKRAHFHALGARRKKILDARARNQERLLAGKSNSLRSKRSMKDRTHNGPHNGFEEDTNFLQVNSALMNGAIGGGKAHQAEVHPRKSFAVNRTHREFPPVDNGIPKSYSTDDDRLDKKYHRPEVLPERRFHSLEEGSEDVLVPIATGPAPPKVGFAGQSIPLDVQSPIVQETTKKIVHDFEKDSPEIINVPGAGSAELYDIPEDPNEDLLGNETDTEKTKSLIEPPSSNNGRVTDGRSHRQPNRYYNETNFSDLKDLDISEKSVRKLLQEQTTTGTKNKPKKKLSDLSVPLLVVPTDRERNSNKVVQDPDTEELIPSSPLIVTAPDKSRETENSGKGKIQKLQPNGKQRRIKDKNGKQRQKKNAIKLHGEIFNFELQDVANANGANVIKKHEKGQNGTFIQTSEFDGQSKVRNENNKARGERDLNEIKKEEEAEDKRKSARELRARFKQAKTSRVLAENLQRDNDDVIFL